MVAKKTGLRAVGPSDQPVKPKTITQAADSGTTRELLVAMRARIATAVEDLETPAKDLAALSNRLMQIVREVELLDARADDEDGDASSVVTDARFDASAV